MKHFKALSLGLSVLFLITLTLAGCGSGISQADYDTLLAQKNALETEKQTLQTNYNSLQTEKNALESEKTAIESEKQTLQTNFDNLKDGYNTLQTQYDVANTELANIKEVYPPRDFSSKTELENWLAQNNVSEEPTTDNAEDWIGRALEVQEDALLGGYIINVDYDYDSTDETYLVYCTTVIDGFIWFWDPETDEISQDTTLGAVE